MLLQVCDRHGSAQQHFSQVCCNMRQPLQNDQPDSLREMVKFLSLHVPKVRLGTPGVCNCLTEEGGTDNFDSSSQSVTLACHFCCMAGLRSGVCGPSCCPASCVKDQGEKHCAKVHTKIMPKETDLCLPPNWAVAAVSCPHCVDLALKQANGQGHVDVAAEVQKLTIKVLCHCPR